MGGIATQYVVAHLTYNCTLGLFGPSSPFRYPAAEDQSELYTSGSEQHHNNEYSSNIFSRHLRGLRPRDGNQWPTD